MMKGSESALTENVHCIYYSLKKKEATNPFPKMLTFKSNFLAYKKYQRKHLKILLKQRN